jgi:CheY-like chemotaxis protein
LGPEIAPLPEGADFTGRTVLLVDDDPRNVFAIQSILGARKMEVLHAENGRVAIDLLHSHPDVDVVLMDVMMPEMDGLEATRAMRELAQFRSLPIITLTAKAMKGDREAALSAGATEYIAKPVDPDRLLAVLYAWMNRPPGDATPGAAKMAS